MTVRGVLETTICAADLEAAERFYTSVMGLRVIARQPGRHVFFACGPGVFLVFNPNATGEPSYVNGGLIPPHGTTGAGHVAFNISESEVDRWRDRLRAAGVAIESEVTWPGGGRSIYFRDPAGNLLEVATPALWGLPDQG